MVSFCWCQAWTHPPRTPIAAKYSWRHTKVTADFPIVAQSPSPWSHAPNHAGFQNHSQSKSVWWSYCNIWKPQHIPCNYCMSSSLSLSMRIPWRVCHSCMSQQMAREKERKREREVKGEVPSQNSSPHTLSRVSLGIRAVRGCWVNPGKNEVYLNVLKMYNISKYISSKLLFCVQNIKCKKHITNVLITSSFHLSHTWVYLI